LRLAGSASVQAGGAGVVGGTQMVNQLVPVLQEGLPGVQVGADRRDHPKAFLG
jgi:hypothetical protein